MSLTFSRLWVWTCSAMRIPLAHYHITQGPLLHKTLRPTVLKSDHKQPPNCCIIYSDCWFYLVSDTVMSSSVSGANANWMTNDAFSTQTKDQTQGLCESVFFLCFSASSLSPLPLVFRSRPTLSVGRREKRCLANAPAGSALALVSILTCDCKSTNKQLLWKRQADLSTSPARSGMTGGMVTA